MTWAGWMRRWARRVARRRSSWTDQRTRSGVPGSGQARRCVLWGGLVCAMADAGHHGKRQHDQADVPVPAVPGPVDQLRCSTVVVRAKHGLGGLEAVLDGPAAALDLAQLGGTRAGQAPDGEDRKRAVGQAAPDQQAAGPSAAQRLVELSRVKVGQPEVGPIVKAWTLVPGPAARRCQSEASSAWAISSAGPDTAGVRPQAWKRCVALTPACSRGQRSAAPSRPRPRHRRCRRPPTGTAPRRRWRGRSCRWPRGAR